MRNFFTNFIFLSFILLIHITNPALIFSKESQNENATFYKQVFVDIDQNDYYFYQVYIKDDKQVFIQLFDGYLNSITLPFQTENQLYFRDAYKNFIIVQEKLSQNATLYYWILKIVKHDFSYQLEYFNVSSEIDNQNYLFLNAYTLTSIIQYDQQKKFLYVLMNETYDINVYGIDTVNNGTNGRMICQGFFYYQNTLVHQYIIGGNKKVLVDANSDQFLIDQNNSRANTSDPTIYKKINISTITNNTIYPGGSAVYNLIDWYFQYVSWSPDYKNMTAFVYYGYNQQKPFGEFALASTTAIKIHYDSYSYFIAVSDTDIYLTYVYWSDDDNNYKSFSSLLSSVYLNQTRLQSIVKNISSALQIVLIDEHFYVISQQYFWVYSLNATPDPLIYTKELEKSEDNTENAIQRLFEQIKIYRDRRG